MGTLKMAPTRVPGYPVPARDARVPHREPPSTTRRSPPPAQSNSGRSQDQPSAPLNRRGSPHQHGGDEIAPGSRAPVPFPREYPAVRIAPAPVSDQLQLLPTAL